jgi:phosphatidylglycerol:prolipoprotein diacylglycerol transferase
MIAEAHPVLMTGAIPYHTFPNIPLGPITLHTFGVAVALGLAAGISIAAWYAARSGISSDRVVRLAITLAVVGFVGARIAWVLTHLSSIDSPVDVVAVWKGGLAFSGGFLAAAVVALILLRRWAPLERWILADGIALGLTVGVAIGRIGCISVGEHLGHTTSFVLGWRYLGGVTREGPLVVGSTYHNTAIYEFLHLWLLAALLWGLSRRPDTRPGTLIGVFCVWYGLARFATDFLRAYDHRVLWLTGAQWMCIVLAGAGTWILATTRRRAVRIGATSHTEPA